MRRVWRGHPARPPSDWRRLLLPGSVFGTPPIATLPALAALVSLPALVMFSLAGPANAGAPPMAGPFAATLALPAGPVRSAPSAPSAAAFPPAALGPTAVSLADRSPALAGSRTLSGAGPNAPATRAISPAAGWFPAGLRAAAGRRAAAGWSAVAAPRASAPPAPVPAPAPVLRLAGHGAGDGVGLGQYGAFGYATALHASWQWIIGHYYAGAYLEPLAAAVAHQLVDVELLELNGAAVTLVRAAPGAGVAINGRLVRGTTVRVGHPPGRAVDVTASSGDLQVDLPGVGWRAYQGMIQVQPDGSTWNVLPLEEYVSGVVPAESIASWGAAAGGAGEAALQAQAVAARSYALASIAARGWICDTPLCQNYLGDPADQGLGWSLPYVLTAVSSTAGEVVCTSNADPCPLAAVAVAQYGASTGGWTQGVNSQGETFSAVPDAGDAVAGNPFHTWVVGDGCPTVVPAATVGADFGVGTVVGARVISRNGDGAYGGRAVEVELIGRQGVSTQTVTVSGPLFAATLGLCSDWFAFY